MIVTLRRLEMADAPEIARMVNNRKIWDNLRDFIPNPYGVEDGEFFVDLTQKENPPQTFGIVFNETELCGVMGLVIQKDVHRFSAEIGYWIGEEFWGKGIGTKAINLMVDYGFNELSLNRIYSGVFEYNQPSMRILEKCGFVKEGILKKAVYKNGKFWDEHRYALLKPE
ncbi:MAG: GNAT family N-acetyltransferase [Cytophagaceae bacterium]|nr:GNAT family N-acetyltransferase [Cytophagaceae bacterium]MBL0303251.1 GNAT family N-acetyltransferase [Cytophagaceae bacterium]